MLFPTVTYWFNPKWDLFLNLTQRQLQIIIIVIKANKLHLQQPSSEMSGGIDLISQGLPLLLLLLRPAT